MAKKTIKKYYRRKGRWSANIKTLTSQAIQAGIGTFFGVTDLCTNPVQTDNSVSQQYTVKNVEVSFEIDFPNGQASALAGINIEALVTYIMFVPQGMTVTETYPNTHPEYIMAYKFYGSPNYEFTANDIVNPGRNAVRVKTRLSRRLQTGDKIILLIVGNNNGNNSVNLDYNGIVRWWTKAN